MRKIMYGMIVSVDGFIEDREGRIDWTTPDEEIHRHFNALERDTVLHFCGRKLYEIMEFWRTAEQTQSLHDYEIEFARLYLSKPNIVFSKTLEKVAPGDTLVRDINVDYIKHQKKLPGKYISIGGADLAGTFMQLNLIDEIRLYMLPIVLGGGKPMFHSQQHKLNMKLVENKAFESGMVLLRYQKGSSD
jgi:dihydrofolate reductase